jgi:hypothetical protein
MKQNKKKHMGISRIEKYLRIERGFISQFFRSGIFSLLAEFMALESALSFGCKGVL